MRTILTVIVSATLLFSSVMVVFITEVAATEKLATEKVEIVSFDYPPMFSEQDPKGGLLGEIVHEAFKQELVDVSIDYYPPKRVDAKMVGSDKTLATIMPVNLVKRNNKEKDVICISPMANIVMTFYYYAPRYKQEIRFENLDDLKPYIVGTIRGSNAIKILKNAGIMIDESSKESQIKKLHKGRVDLAIMGLLTGKVLINEFYPNEVDNFKTLKKPLMELPLSICFNRRFPRAEEFSQKFIQGLDKIRENGIYTKILEKYYGKGEIPERYNYLFETMDSNYIMDWSK